MSRISIKSRRASDSHPAPKPPIFVINSRPRADVVAGNVPSAPVRNEGGWHACLKSVDLKVVRSDGSRRKSPVAPAWLLQRFYGRVVPEAQLCPGRVPGRLGYDATCDVIQAKSRLSELCDKKRKCTVYVDTTTFEDDPCPTTSKYLQMSYKCRPILFDGESFCEGAEMQLECREGRRLAIYSANYGRSMRTQAAHCTAPVHFAKGITIAKNNKWSSLHSK
ncbi:unnamed protein product [Nippostrongylus brasiliensis]|uniref:SUEL-type lectin domain-containing protein n=1 Tax=Nippostrongylus brasiliensis TaxID=27835 RepID=A0A158QZB8_NIPBR|nr:unnamed protein product [Nippostrongylus brasiliensis]